jgi:sugar-specific transcriptional regulator TrmB
VDHEIVAALTELGLNPTEAELYVALLRQAATEPVSAYKLAKVVGRDPANTTKTLAALERRGAVRVTAEKPRLYAPVAAADFTEALVLRLQSRRREAVQMLEKIGHAESDRTAHPLRDRGEAIERARMLIGEAQSVILVDADTTFVTTLAGDLQVSAHARGVAVLVLTERPLALPGVQSWVDPGAEELRRAAPGPWLHLVADGAAELRAVVHPGDPARLLTGHWHRNLVDSFLAHRTLGVLMAQAALHVRLAAGVDSAAASRQIVELQSLLTQRIGWRARWTQLGLPAIAPTTPAPVAAPPPATAATAAAVLATPARPEPTPPPPRRATRAPAPAPAKVVEDAGPLQFLHRRKKPG